MIELGFLGEESRGGSRSRRDRGFSLASRNRASAPPILLHGEAGVGKSLLARLIHQAGPRPDGPFLVFEDSAIPELLHEAALFGIERGTSAPPRPGLFQRAHGGTLFLDGVGRLPLNLQPKILRVLERRAASRVGSTRAEPAAVWIIAATSEDLEAAVLEGRFSADLYQQLGQLVFRIQSDVNICHGILREGIHGQPCTSHYGPRGGSA
jgi:transcriptional regulator with PAS, ATPase and Fis domain